MLRRKSHIEVSVMSFRATLLEKCLIFSSSLARQANKNRKLSFENFANSGSLEGDPEYKVMGEIFRNAKI